jgi:RNA polymerase subunit RPABC4/transcription elongation factor Spt4
MINKAKCDTCGKVSTLDAWAGTAGYNDSSQKVIMEKCPICGTVSYTVDNEGNIVDVHKIQLGTLIYFQKDGKLSIKITDGLSENKGDTFASGSLIDIEFDDKSNLVMTGIQNFTESYISKLEIAKQNNTVSAGGIVTFIGNVNLPTEQQITIANDIKLGKDASKLVARKTDAIKSTDSEDSTYWDWFSDFATKVTDWINRANSGATPDPTLLVDIQAWQALNPTPDSLTGQITEGSSKVKAED